MDRRSAPRRVVAVLVFFVLAGALAFVAPELNSKAQRSPKQQNAMLAPSINASDAVTFAPGGDVDSDGKADPGDTLQYTVTVNNTGPDPATGVKLDSTLQNITTLVGGSIDIGPIAANETFGTIGNVNLVIPDGAGDLLSNDTDPDGGAITMTGFGNTLATASANLPGATITSANGGSLQVNANGSFNYNPPRGVTTTETFFYTISDPNGVTDTAQVTINISGKIWFINNTGGACASNCDGRLTNPYTTLAAFQAVNTSGAAPNPTDNDNIFLYNSGTQYSGPVTLRNSQKLIGQGAGATLLSISALSAPSGTNQLPTTVLASYPILISGGNTITLGQNNLLRGLRVDNATTAKIVGTGFGTLTFGDTTNPDMFLAGTGKAFDINNGTFAATSAASNVITTSSATHGMQLLNIHGTVAFGQTQVSGSGNQGIYVNASDVNLNFGNTTVTGSGAGTEGVRLENNTGGTRTFGTLTITNASNQGFTDSGGGSATVTGLTTITNPGGVGILIQNKTAGTAVTFANVSDTASGGIGVQLSGNAGTVSFADLDIDTDANVRAFQATNNTGVITTTSGTIADTGTSTAVEITGTSAASRTPLNMQLTSVTSNGGSSNGIILTNTNGTGFSIIGTGSAGSGGTIANKTGADASTTQGTGIYLNTVNNVSFDRMQLNDFQNFGISGTTVSGFTLNNTTVNGTNGTLQGGLGEGAVYFADLTGSASVSNSNFSGAAYDTFHVFNAGGSLNRITITNCTFAMTNTSGSDALAFQATGGTFNATVQSSAMTSARGDLFQLNMLGTVSSDLIFGGATAALGNTLTNNNANIVSGGGGITIGGGGPTNNITLTYNISHNLIKGSHGAVLAVFKGTGTNASFSGMIDSNTIGTQNVTGSGSTQGDGIAVFQDGAGNSNTTITNNHVSGTVGGIHLLNKNGALGSMTAVIQSNTIDTLDQVNTFSGMYLQTGSNSISGGSPDNNKGCLTIGGAGALKNIVDVGVNTAGNIAAGTTIEQEGNSHVGFPSYAGGNGTNNADDIAVQTFVTGNNTFTGNNAQAILAFNDSTNPVSWFQGCGSLRSTESGSDMVDGIGNSFSFLNTTYSLPLDQFSCKCAPKSEPISLQAEASADLSEPITTESSFINALNALSETVAKLGEMIVPTARAQERTTPSVKTDTPSKNASPESGEAVTTTPAFTLPAGESVKIVYRATVNDGPYAAGINTIDNQATISGANFSNAVSNTASIALDAAPELTATNTDGATQTQPGAVITYTIGYANGSAINGQGATGVTLTETVPANTTFTGAGWTCLPNNNAGSTCSRAVGALNAGASGSAPFQVTVIDAVPATGLAIANTASVADDGANGAELNTGNNSAPDSDDMIGVWLGGTSNDWFTPANWSNTTSPSLLGQNISVPSGGGANSPNVTGLDVTVNKLTFSGKNMTIASGLTVLANGAVTLAGNTVSGAGTLELANAAPITRTTGQVEATLKKNFNTTGAFIFPVGTTGARYSPVDVTVTSGTGNLSVRANTGVAPLAPVPLSSANTLHRYWSLSGTGIVSNITFHYLSTAPTDIFGNEAVYQIIRVSNGNTAIRYLNDADTFVTPASDSFTVIGLTTYSDWTAGEPLAPTAANAAIGGRVLAANGHPIANVKVVLTGGDLAEPRIVYTGSLGYYNFPDLPVGQVYVVTVKSRRFTFADGVRVVNFTDSTQNLDFIAEPQE